MKAVYDCQTCGACCGSPDMNRAMGVADWVKVDPDDAILKNAKLARRFVVLNERDEPWLRMDKDFRCAALRGTVGRAVECSIYEDRPGPCRRMEPGSPSCLSHRMEHGIDPRPDPVDEKKPRKRGYES